MEVRVQKKKNKFPVDGKKLHTVWKILAVILSICVLAGGIALVPGWFRKAQAGIDPTKYSKEHPFVVLEIVPYEGQGQWGYTVSGQEPVSAEKIREYHQIANNEKDYWQNTNQDNTFDIEFKFSGLVRDAQNKGYSNRDTFIKQILCRDSGNPDDWAGKVKVQSKSACEVTVQDVKTADLVVVQSNETAYKYNAYSNTPLYVYWKYNNPSVMMRTGNGTAIDPLNKEQAVYEGEISKDAGATWKSMDMQWDVALAVLDHAYTNNKATIVASEKTSGNVENNIDKLILLLTKLTRKAYVDDGIDKMITTAANGKGGYTGSFNGQLTWNEKLFYDALLLDRTSFVDSFEKLKYFVYNPSEQYSPSGDLKTFLNNFRSMSNQSNEQFYQFIDSELWDEIIKYAKLLRDKGDNAGKLTDSEYQWFVDCRTKYEKKQICKLEDKYEVGYDVLHNGGYSGKTEWDNVIRYMEGWINYPFVPVSLADSSKHQIDVEEILLGGVVTPDGPPEDATDGSIKVLEIEPCNNYWLSVPGNLPKFATAIGVDEDDISVTYVTPNTLNGMAVDLVAEYDLILIGDDASLLNSSGGGGSKSVKYRSNGFPDDAIIPQTLINGLLVNDYTTKERFDIDITKKTSGVSLNTGSYPLTGSGSTNWNPLLRENWSKLPGEYFLKNVELSLELQALGADTTVSKARFSGNDVTQFMQKQLAEFVKSGQPVIISEQLVTDATKQINEFEWIDMNNNPYNAECDIDSRLLFALYGIEDVKDYYNKSLDKSYFDKLILMDSKITNPTTKTVDLKKDFKSSVIIKDSELIKDENDEVVTAVIQKGWNSDTRPELNTLAKSNTLTFDYAIEMPLGDKAENIIMKIIVDRNGDGYFDEGGDGSSTSGKPGAHNNASASIKNDQVFTCRFADLSPNDYTVEGSRLTGRYTTPMPVDSIEEICQFQVKVSTLDNKNPLYSVWTGYMRPDLKKEDVKVLQITPYSDTIGGKTLDKNPQFTRLIEEAEQSGGEYHFDFENGDFETISEGDFAAACAGGEINPTTLSSYDLIVVGTDFSSELKGDIIDLDTKEAEKVLKSYSEELKKPIIFTNDAFSYVNSENYYAPEEVDYYYRNMTIEEGRKENPAESDSNYKKVPISEEQYNNYVERNEKEWKENNKNIGEGTVYLDPSGLHSVVDQAGSYRALVRPIAADSAAERKIANEYIGWNLSDWDWIKGGGRDVTSSKNGTIRVSAYEFYKQFPGMVYREKNWLGHSYYTYTGYITESEARALYENGNGKPRTTQIGINTFNITNLHASLGTYETISANIVDELNPIIIAGDTYYKFKSNGVEYLAVRIEESVIRKEGYVWQKKVAGDSENPVETKYALNNVAGKGDSLYSSQNAWNYLFTQKLRYTAGMDRFAITTDIDPKDKRDKGSSRRWTEIEELQGFTNGALLEYAFIPKEGSSYASLVNTASPYNTQMSLNLALGVKPRTEYIEPLNEGQIGLYPFKISDEVSEAKVKVAKNHAPYYQLDLERELGAGKIDDVTVWYTFAGSGIDDESKYFDTTVRDARNNYYLYSKGKIYYTGFSLCDETEGADSEDIVPDMEMKLFINTIYAALNGETEETAYYDTVLQEGGTVSGIELAQDVGAPNRYTCYYDEYDEALEFSFRVQKINAADGETTPITVGRKGGKGENGLPEVDELDETAYTLTGLPEENGVSNFPVVKVTGETGKKGSLGSGVSDIWYTLRFNGDKGEGKIPDDMDGMTLVIGPKSAESKILRPDSIYAEIRFVKRNLFELD